MSDNSNPEQVRALLSDKKRGKDASSGGRRLELDPRTGKLVVRSANEQPRGDAIPLQKVGGWA